MKSRIVPFLLLISIFLSCCSSKKQKENTLSISGAFALYPLVVTWSEAYKEVNPEVRFNISAGGAGKGMADALAGTIDLGMFSREILQEEINKGVWWVGLSIDAVLPTISAENPGLVYLKQHGIKQEELRGIFIEENITSWGQLIKGLSDSRINVYTRSDACGAAGTWALYLGGKQENLKGIGIYGDPGLAEAVSKDPYGISFNNTIYVYDLKSGKKRDGIEVIPIDINENGVVDPEENFYKSFDSMLIAIADGKYPSPPARELYFVSKGKPLKPLAVDFIRWVLTEGQQYVKEAGYVPLHNDRIKVYLDKLD